MDKKDFIIIGLLIIIVAMVAYGVISSQKSTEPVTLELSECSMTVPAGTHYHEVQGNAEVYLHENDSIPFISISNSSQTITAEEFDSTYNELKNDKNSRQEILELSNSDPNGTLQCLDVNVGDFNGEPEISMVTQLTNTTHKQLVHMIKHNNKTYFVVESMDNDLGKQSYNTIKLK